MTKHCFQTKSFDDCGLIRLKGIEKAPRTIAPVDIGFISVKFRGRTKEILEWKRCNLTNTFWRHSVSTLALSLAQDLATKSAIFAFHSGVFGDEIFVQ